MNLEDFIQLHGLDTPTARALRTFLGESPDGTAPPGDGAAVSSDRYEDLGSLGAGGMGEVRRVHDRLLDRVVAMKVSRPGSADPEGRRFLAEARATARLQHPGIVPLLDCGTLPDGRPFFTMPEVRGRTLAELIPLLHNGPFDTSRLHPFVGALLQASDAVAYAHSREVVHRDLKPDNVMCGEFGQVVVLDWGIAHLNMGPDATPGAGTPGYMAPEQAAGSRRVDARSDVYALGASLYHVLSGAPPYAERRGEDIVAALLAGPPRALPDGRGMPPDLVSICERAMARDPADRFPDAGGLAQELRSWLDGVTRRERAAGFVGDAEQAEREAAHLRARSAELRRQAAERLAGVRPFEPAELKHDGWALQDEATRLARAATRAYEQAGVALHVALVHAPDLDAANAHLALRWLDQHRAAEVAHDADALDRAELWLREHASALPVDHRVRQRCERWLDGQGTLAIHTEPAGARVTLHTLEERHRRLVAVAARNLGVTPLVEVPVPMGSYLAVIELEGHAAVRYPVHVGREESWDGVAPGEAGARPVRLLRTEELGPDEVYVPAGWFRSGGDALSIEGLPLARHWCDAFVIQRYPVTNRDYLRFLDDLVATGDEALARRLVPSERQGSASADQGAPIYARRPDGTFTLVADADGDLWDPDWPVMMVDFACAIAYARWLATRTGLPWRLPVELEWEKAARGVDGRAFPWGDHLDPSWCNGRDGHPVRPLPARVYDYPLDESVYGVRGMGGNVEDWCAELLARAPSTDGARVLPLPLPVDPSLDAADRRVVRGGNFLGGAFNSRCATRAGPSPASRFSFLGFRLVRSL